jgi:N-formylglutamate deformylase
MSALLELPEVPAPFVVERPVEQTCPIVFSSPHSGRNYSADFMTDSRLDARALRRSEDSFVDELFGFAPAFGAPLISANFPRAFCDVNRERWELDPDMFSDPLPGYCNVTSRRVAAGFGTIARVVASGEAIYRRKLRFEEARMRVETCWEPYHAALRALIDATSARFGGCLVIDCHSMPEDAPRFREQARFVLGDAHGASCAPKIVQVVESQLQASGYVVRRNDPYAGGYVTRFYGRPTLGIHVLQLEIARRLYMDERRNEKRPGFDVLRADLMRLVGAVIRHLADDPDALAAG